MKNKTILVTGATAGIGRETARGLARLGARVIVGGRDEAKTRAVVESIRNSTGNPNVDYVLGDLSSTAQTLAPMALAALWTVSSMQGVSLNASPLPPAWMFALTSPSAATLL